VHGDYSLWFVARRLGWRFTTEVYGRDANAAIFAGGPDFLIEEEARPSAVRSDHLGSWAEVEALRAVVPAGHRAPVFGVLPSLRVYRRVPSATPR
jgi:hypothetical protein